MAIPKKNRLLKIIGISLLILLFIGYLVYDSVLTGIVKSELTSQFNRNPDSYYEIHFKSMDLNIITKSLTVDEITITPREFAYDSLNAGKLRTLVRSTMKELHLKNFKVFDFLKNKVINLKGLSFDDIDTYYISNPNAEKSKKSETTMLHQIFSDQFKGIEIKNIDIIDASFKFARFDSQDDPTFVLDSVSLGMHDVKIDPSTLEQPIPISFSDIEIRSKIIAIHNVENYTISSSGISASIIDSTLSIRDFKLTPKYSRDEFSKRLKYENDVFTILSELIQLKGLDINAVKFNKQLSLKLIEIDNPLIEIYRDKRLADQPSTYKPLIGSLINKIPIEINIDNLSIINARLEYLERVEHGDKPGNIYFDPLFISIYNITNITEKINVLPIMEADISGKLMGQGDIDVKIRFDLASSIDQFAVNGHMGPIDATAINPVTENLLSVKVKSGDIHEVKFHFNANDKSSIGSSEIIYENLKVEVLKAKEGKHSGALSFVANNIIKSHNMKERPKYKTGTIYFERNQSKALPNYLWKSFQSGLISIMAPVATTKEQKVIIKTEANKKKGKKNKS
jgi:hypothetical protein